MLLTIDHCERIFDARISQLYMIDVKEGGGVVFISTLVFCLLC